MSNQDKYDAECQYLALKGVESPDGKASEAYHQAFSLNQEETRQVQKLYLAGQIDFERTAIRFARIRNKMRQFCRIYFRHICPRFSISPYQKSIRHVLRECSVQSSKLFGVFWLASQFRTGIHQYLAKCRQPKRSQFLP